MNLMFRVDASTYIGHGHVMRCLALAQAWKSYGEQGIFVMFSPNQLLIERWQQEGFRSIQMSSLAGSLEDARETANLAKQFNVSWIVVDGYQFNAEYQKIIKDAELKLLFIDDYGHAKHYYADIILNQNISADESLYTNRESYTQLLLGTHYTLLRQEFWQWQGWKRINPLVASKILVTMGGADPDNVTLKVIQALEFVKVDGLEVIVVVGASNPHDEQLQVTAKESKLTIHIEKNVTNMPELMAWADVAITAGGSTCWELAFMGLPSLILVLAENQRAIAQQLHKLEAGINLGWYEDISSEEIGILIAQFLLNFDKRQKISQLLQTLVDGDGSSKVLMLLQDQAIRLRQVRQDDCKLLWEWVNDLEVRKSAFSSNFINWEDHVKWFANKLKDPSCYIFIAIDQQEQPIGQVRFDINLDHQAEIDVSIAASQRGMGYASQIINRAIQKLLLDQEIYLIHSFIKLENTASIKAFEKAGFKKIGLKTVKNNQAFHYLWSQQQ